MSMSNCMSSAKGDVKITIKTEELDQEVSTSRIEHSVKRKTLILMNLTNESSI